jgi:hypothetical protein
MFVYKEFVAALCNEPQTGSSVVLINSRINEQILARSCREILRNNREDRTTDACNYM